MKVEVRLRRNFLADLYVDGMDELADDSSDILLGIKKKYLFLKVAQLSFILSLRDFLRSLVPMVGMVQM